MAFPSSGEMNGYGWVQEMTANAYTAVVPETIPAADCETILLAQDINQNSSSKPDTAGVWNNAGEYQGLGSGGVTGFDFYGYDHDAAPSFSDDVSFDFDGTNDYLSTTTNLSSAIPTTSGSDYIVME